jgi:carbohydrate-selective porin OprB
LKGFIKLALLIIVFTLVVPAKMFSADSVAEQFGLKVKCGGTFVLQDTPKENIQNDVEGASAGVYLFDLTLEKNFEHNGKVLVKFEGGRGKGLNDKVQTYAGVNAVADPSLNDAADTLAKVTKLYYQQSIFDDKLTIDFGKLSFGSFFADNKYSGDCDCQFITSIFSGDKIIETPPQRLALALTYNIIEKFKITYAYFSTDIDHIDSTGVNVAQLTYSPCKCCNLLAYVWGNNKNHYSLKDINKKSGVYGFGISADHAVSENVGVFGRVSYKDSSVSVLKSTSSEITPTQLTQPLSMSWDAGVQFSGNIWSRPTDTTGFAIGQMYGSKDYKEVDSNYKDGAETEMELYYNFGINKNFAITPAVQYFIDPKGGNALVKDNIVVAGVRTRMSF